MEWSKDYTDFMRHQASGTTIDRDEEDYQQDLELEILDTYVGDDDWHRSLRTTGSIDIDQEWNH